MFVEPATRDSAAYREFRASLNRGEYQSAEYKRIGKGGMEVWILASYNPIIDEKGRPFKVVKFATDVTEQKLRTADLAGQINLLALNATIEGLSRREPNSPDAPAYPMKCTDQARTGEDGGRHVRPSLSGAVQAWPTKRADRRLYSAASSVPCLDVPESSRR